MEQITEKKIEELVQDLMGENGRGRAIGKINFFHDLDKRAIVDVLNKIQMMIFPEYFRNEHYRVYTAKNFLTVLIEDVLYNLSKQIAVILKYERQFDETQSEEARAQSMEITLQFLSAISKVREYADTDVEAAYEGDPAAYNKDEIIFCYPGFYAILVYRIAHELYRLNVPLIPRIMTEHAHSITGVDIHPGAKIGKYFFIDHGTGIVIGETTVIGDHVKIYQGVTLGALSTRGGQALKNVRRHPTIEDNVTIYSGASILGGETVIGREAVVGGNVFITKSVPAGAIVNLKNQDLVYRYAACSHGKCCMEEKQ